MHAPKWLFEMDPARLLRGIAFMLACLPSLVIAGAPVDHFRDVAPEAGVAHVAANSARQDVIEWAKIVRDRESALSVCDTDMMRNKPAEAELFDGMVLLNGDVDDRAVSTRMGEIVLPDSLRRSQLMARLCGDAIPGS